MQPRLVGIRVYPFKSLDPVALESATVLPSGALAGDRRYAFIDGKGKFVNGKNSPGVCSIRSEFDTAAQRLTVWPQGEETRQAFDLPAQIRDLCQWMGDRLGMKVGLAEDRTFGLPDDPDLPGPTLIGAATLHEVAGWFPGMTVEDARRRFRANLEIDGVPPFWEDLLCARTPTPFSIGEAAFDGMNACQRCLVPTLSPTTGEPWPDFAPTFRERRRATLPTWSGISPDDHFYRLSVNTRPSPGGTGGRVRIGDKLQLAARSRA